VTFSSRSLATVHVWRRGTWLFTEQA